MLGVFSVQYMQILLAIGFTRKSRFEANCTYSQVFSPSRGRKAPKTESRWEECFAVEHA